MAVAKIADNFDLATNPYPHPNATDFEHEIRIRRMWILAGSVTSLLSSKTSFHIFRGQQQRDNATMYVQ